ncbi:NADH dehydrogenase subunit 4 (mitochondrion) [Rhopilema esculentum]|uniref:NADH-ubiquinone oxidoreductase chain 4 n=1 Tax=Rhopilema esculentum TaxID=499914 RepID=A0A222YW37_9CNID|nr:NADH dehydrogenase subunit 4 [Rhopilema esculentum]ASR75177.1 NADH dehydrogenase subunit 4 [Rhopilema esculentum]
MWLSIALWSFYTYDTLFHFNTSKFWTTLLSNSVQWGPLHFAIDQISLPFILLTGLLTPICILISWTSIKFLVKEFILLLLVIHLLLIGVFASLNILLFYISFEGILIPMFLIIGIWGSRKEKERAAFYFFFFTLVGSLFMLLGIFTLYKYFGTLDYQTLILSNIPVNIQYWIFASFFLSLAVKVPKLPVHIWLPQAHVEAPVAGSVLLAGVLLKLGGYGLIRFSWPLLPQASEFFSPLIILLGSLAVVYASLSTCRQTDSKKLVAYSSVAHMGLVTVALFSKTPEGVVAAIILMVAHGFVSSGLFIVVTNLYERLHTRVFRYYRGVVYLMPLFTTLFFLLILGNIAFPISLNFIGEFISILSAFQYSIIAILCPLLGMVLSAAYSLVFFNKISFGTPSKHTYYIRDINRRELHSPLILLFLTIVLGLSPTSIGLALSLPYF